MTTLKGRPRSRRHRSHEKGWESETSQDFPGLLVCAAALALVAPTAAIAAPPSGNATASRLVTGLQGGSGSTIGPGGALYVTETAAGRITRADPKTGATTTYATGLPQSIIGVGGAMDIAFIGRTAYVLVTLVGPNVGGSDVVGIYRVDGPHSFTVVANIGKFATNNPPKTAFDILSGLQYALEPYRGGFLVTDGHHNRVYRVTRDGKVTQLIAFGNIVPTGLAVRGKPSTWPRPAPSPTCPRTARLCRSGRSRPQRRRWPLAVLCSLTWSLAGTGCTHSPRASGLAALRALPRCRILAPW
jgi:hypothetical protein